MRAPKQRFDVLGAVLSAAGFGLLVVATLLAGRYGHVRINARAREQALTVAVTGMALLAFGGYLLARRLPRVTAGGRRPT
ncbi:hypothetical protein [Streptomyces sp. NPDC001450]